MHALHVLRTVRASVAGNQQLQNILNENWTSYTGTWRRAKHGLLQTIVAVYDALHWSPKQNLWLVSRPEDTDFSILWGGNTFFKREVFRSCCWSTINNMPTRKDFTWIRGLTKHVDIDATTSLIAATGIRKPSGPISKLAKRTANTMDAYDATLLRRILTGAIYTADRLAAAGKISSDICARCGKDRETPQHLFVQCKCNVQQRTKLSTCTLQKAKSQPTFAVTGVLLESARLQSHRKELAGPVYVPKQTTVHLSDPDIFTDGACRDQQNANIRHAAGAMVMADDTHIALPLPGQDQSAPRSEIWAAAIALANTTGNIVIRSDNQYVCNTLQKIIEDPEFFPSNDFDLWHVVTQCIAGRHGTIAIRKVKGHAKWENVKHCPNLTWEKERNDLADKAAVAAVRPIHLRGHRDNQVCTAVTYQMYCITALKQRKYYMYDLQDDDVHKPTDTLEEVHADETETTAAEHESTALTVRRRLTGKQPVRRQPEPAAETDDKQAMMTNEEYIRIVRDGRGRYNNVPDYICDRHARFLLQPGFLHPHLIPWTDMGENVKAAAGSPRAYFQTSSFAVQQGQRMSCTFIELAIDFLVDGGRFSEEVSLYEKYDLNGAPPTIGIQARRFAKELLASFPNKHCEHFQIVHTIPTLTAFNLNKTAKGINLRPRLKHPQIVTAILMDAEMQVAALQSSHAFRQQTALKWSFDPTRWRTTQ